MLFDMDCLEYLHAWILDVKGSLGSIRELCISIVLMVMCTGYWVSQVRITELINL